MIVVGRRPITELSCLEMTVLHVNGSSIFSSSAFNVSSKRKFAARLRDLRSVVELVMLSVLEVRFGLILEGFLRIYDVRVD